MTRIHVRLSVLVLNLNHRIPKLNDQLTYVLESGSVKIHGPGVIGGHPHVFDNVFDAQYSRVEV